MRVIIVLCLLSIGLFWTVEMYAQDTIPVKKPKVISWCMRGESTNPLSKYFRGTLVRDSLVKRGFTDLPQGDSIWRKFEGQDTIKAFANEGFKTGWGVIVAIPISVEADSAATIQLLTSVRNYDSYLKCRSTWYNAVGDTFFMQYEFLFHNYMTTYSTQFKTSLRFKLRFVDAKQNASPYLTFAIVVRSPKRLNEYGSLLGNDLLPVGVGFSDEVLRRDKTTFWYLDSLSGRSKVSMNKRLSRFDLKRYIKDTVGSPLRFDLLSITKDSCEFTMDNQGIINAIFDTDSLKNHPIDIQVRISSLYIKRLYTWTLDFDWSNWRALNGAAANVDTCTIFGSFRVYTSTIVPYTKPEDAIVVSLEDSTLQPKLLRSLNKVNFNPEFWQPAPGDSVFAIAKAVYTCNPLPVYKIDTLVKDSVVVRRSSKLKSSSLQKASQKVSGSRTLVITPHSLNIKVSKKSGVQVPTIRPVVYRGIINDSVVITPIKYVYTDPKDTTKIITPEDSVKVSTSLLSDVVPLIGQYYIKIPGYTGKYSLVDMRGRVLLTGIVNDESIDISFLSSGVYVLNLERTAPIKFTK